MYHNVEDFARMRVRTCVSMHVDGVGSLGGKNFLNFFTERGLHTTNESGILPGVDTTWGVSHGWDNITRTNVTKGGMR